MVPSISHIEMSKCLLNPASICHFYSSISHSTTPYRVDFVSIFTLSLREAACCYVSLLFEKRSTLRAVYTLSVWRIWWSILTKLRSFVKFCHELVSICTYSTELTCELWVRRRKFLWCISWIVMFAFKLPLFIFWLFKFCRQSRNLSF